jgi:hypothetical protein
LPQHAAPVELVPLIDIERDTLRGRWLITREGVLHGRSAINEPRPQSLLVLPWDPPTEYRLRLTVTRMGRNEGFMTLSLASGPTRLGVVFDATHERKVFTGLSVVDGQRLHRYRRIGPLLPPGVPIHLVCTIRAGQLTINANGSEIFRWEGDFSRLSRPAFQPAEPLILGCADKGLFAFENIVLEPLGPDAGRPLRE